MKKWISIPCLLLVCLSLNVLEGQAEEQVATEPSVTQTTESIGSQEEEITSKVALGTIKELFPDPYLARWVANMTGLAVTGSVSQEQLNTVHQVQVNTTSGTVESSDLDQVTNWEGVQYLQKISIFNLKSINVSDLHFIINEDTLTSLTLEDCQGVNLANIIGHSQVKLANLIIKNSSGNWEGAFAHKTFDAIRTFRFTSSDDTKEERILKEADLEGTSFPVVENIEIKNSHLETVNFLASATKIRTVSIVGSDISDISGLSMMGFDPKATTYSVAVKKSRVGDETFSKAMIEMNKKFLGGVEKPVTMDFSYNLITSLTGLGKFISATKMTLNLDQNHISALVAPNVSIYKASFLNQIWTAEPKMREADFEVDLPYKASIGGQSEFVTAKSIDPNVTVDQENGIIALSWAGLTTENELHYSYEVNKNSPIIKFSGSVTQPLVDKGYVTIQWLDTNNNELIPAEVVSGMAGTVIDFASYENKASGPTIKIENKTNDVVNGNSTLATFDTTQDKNKIIFYKDREPAGDVIVHYVSTETNNEFATETVDNTDKKEGDSYEITPKNFPDIELDHVAGALKGEFLKQGETVDVTLYYKQKSFEMTIPDQLSFGVANKISVKEQVVPREKADWSIHVGNPQKKAWSLEAAVTSLDADTSLTDFGQLVYKTDAAEQILDSTATEIFQGQADVAATDIQWNEDRGLLYKTNPYTTKAGNFSAKITWTIIEGP